MPRIDAYLRSIEKLNALGAVITSGQPIVLRLADGDRNATQMVPHEQLVAMVREIAPPPAVDAVDAGRPARFEFDGGTQRYRFEVSPAPGRWTVTIAAVTASAGAPSRAPAEAPPDAAGLELQIERTNYDLDDDVGALAPTGFDAAASAARRAGASDVFLFGGQPPMARIGGALQPIGDRPVDADSLESDLSAIVSTELRARWHEQGAVVFATNGSSAGRMRVHWARDRHGSTASIRLVAAEPPAFDQLGVPAGVERWLAGAGLVLIAGAAGSGRSTTLASMIARLGAGRAASIVTIEAPIELVQTSRRSVISQREVPTHAATIRGAIEAASREGPEVIAIDAISRPDEALAALHAARGGALVLAVVGAGTPAGAIEHLGGLAGAVAPPDLVRGMLAEAFVGSLLAVRGRQGVAFAALAGSPEASAYIRAGRALELDGAA